MFLDIVVVQTECSPKMYFVKGSYQNKFIFILIIFVVVTCTITNRIMSALFNGPTRDVYLFIYLTNLLFYV